MLSDTIKTLIRNAWDDGYPCLVATHGPQGPNITPKGSMIVFDDAHLAWWERCKRAVLENLGHDKRVCVMYANFKAQRDGMLEVRLPALLRFGRAARNGPVREAIFAKLLPREQTHVGAEAGIGVLVRIDKAIDVRGKPIHVSKRNWNPLAGVGFSASGLVDGRKLPKDSRWHPKGIRRPPHRHEYCVIGHIQFL